MLRLSFHVVLVPRPPSLVKPQSPEDGEERKLSEVLKTQEGRRTRCPPAVSEKLRQEKEQKEAEVGESCPEREPQPCGRQESSRAAEQAEEAAKGRGDPPGDENLEPASERKVVVRARLQDKDQGVWTPRGEQRKEVKEPPEVGSCRLREVKILTRVGNRSTEEKTSAVTSSPEQQVSRNAWDIRPQGERSWVLGGPERDSPHVPGGKWDLKDFGECFSESCKPRGAGQDNTSFPSLVCAV